MKGLGNNFDVFSGYLVLEVIGELEIIIFEDLVVEKMLIINEKFNFWNY